MPALRAFGHVRNSPRSLGNAKVRVRFRTIRIISTDVAICSETGLPKMGNNARNFIRHQSSFQGYCRRSELMSITVGAMFASGQSVARRHRREMLPPRSLWACSEQIFSESSGRSDRGPKNKTVHNWKFAIWVQLTC